MDAIMLSRIQFGLTAMYHFIFVPLTIGLVILIACMETVYFITKKDVWKQMTKFWGTLFGINFAMGVATGLPLEFQFGTNWAFYSKYVGDVFGPILAIEGMMAFFLEATLIGLFFFGWNRLRPGVHLAVTWVLALATNLSALWILIANAWMQHPSGAYFNPENGKMEISSFKEIFFNMVASAKFTHTVAAGYVTGAVFVCAVSAYYLLQKRELPIARRSFKVGAIFGLISIFLAVDAGDQSGHRLELQPMKLAGVEAMWETQKPPASWTLLGWIDSKNEKTKYAIEIPYIGGLIITRSFTKPVLGIKDLMVIHEQRIKSGIIAYEAVKAIKANPQDKVARETFEKHKEDLGFALLLKKYRPDIKNASEEEIQKAKNDTMPSVGLLFWSFRIMVFCGLAMTLLFTLSNYFIWKKKLEDNRWFLWVTLLALPLPWIAAECGWFVAEHGRQPWLIYNVLPTSVGYSNLSFGSVLHSLIGFALFYSVLFIVDIFLMVKYIKLGPTKVNKGEH